MDLETFGYCLYDLVRKAQGSVYGDCWITLVWLEANKPCTVQGAIDLATPTHQTGMLQQ